MIMSSFESVRRVPARLADPGATRAKLFERLALAFTVARERRALMALNDNALKDIGLSRADAFREGTRSFWDLPVDRLR
jgi:uncharacterized protein YjiS (DUF1127 family)